jgi:hypothetical protein
MILSKGCGRVVTPYSLSMILLSALSTIARADSFSIPKPILYPIAIGVRTEMSATISACVNVVVTCVVIGLPFGLVGMGEV